MACCLKSPLAEADPDPAVTIGPVIPVCHLFPPFKNCAVWQEGRGTGPECLAGLATFRRQVLIQLCIPTHAHPARLQLPQIPQPSHVPGKVSLKPQWAAMKCEEHQCWLLEQLCSQEGQAGHGLLSLPFSDVKDEV